MVFLRSVSNNNNNSYRVAGTSSRMPGQALLLFFSKSISLEHMLPTLMEMPIDSHLTFKLLFKQHTPLAVEKWRGDEKRPQRALKILKSKGKERERRQNQDTLRKQNR